MSLLILGKSTCTVITLANWEWFEQWKDARVMKRGEEYERIKNGIAQRMWEQVLAFYPQLKDKVSGSTPQKVERTCHKTGLPLSFLHFKCLCH